MLNVIIIEDELKTRNLIKNMIAQSFSDIEIVGETESVVDSIKLINELNPDVLLLDINLSDGNGFEILENTLGKKPEKSCNFFNFLTISFLI